MDGNRFDDLTRAIQGGATRRRVLGAVAGGLAAAFGARRAIGAPASKVGICHRTGNGRSKYITVNWNAAPAHAAHGDVIDVDLQTDPNNCGACGNVCGGDGCNTPVCQNGVCATVPGTCEPPNACTTAFCDPDLGCVLELIDCGASDACTTVSCDPAIGCVYEPVICENPDACTFAVCDPVQGCVYDQIPCSSPDGCTFAFCDPATGCVYEPVNCDDGNLCTNDYCDPSVGCYYDPIFCDSPDACTVGYCDPFQGCVYTSLPCDPPDLCTIAYCDPLSGCVYEPFIYEDGNPCTFDYCDPFVGGCRYDPNTGAICTTVDGAPGICNAVGECQPEPVP